MSMMDSIRSKLASLLETMDRSFVEREQHIRLTLLAILTGHHVLLLGPPGTAKSMLARASCTCIHDATFFEYLLSKFTHPDELFGPVSIPGLKEEDYRRLTESYLPRVHVAFLDEIFKANSAILNSLLTLINERIFHHGKHRDPVPLLGMVAASNEPPDPEGGLAALYDRFLVRLPVPPIADEEHFLMVSLGDIPAFEPSADQKLTAEEIGWLRGEARKITADATVRRVLLQIRNQLHEAQIDASDRRWRWAVELLKMSALTSGRAKISLIDVALLEHCFGDPMSSQTAVRKCVRDALAIPLDHRAFLGPLESQWESYGKEPVAGEFLAWHRQIHKNLSAFQALCGHAQAQIDTQVRLIEAEIQNTPWCTEAPPELLAGFVSIRAAIMGYESVASEYRAVIGSFDPVAVIQSWHKSSDPYDPWGYDSWGNHQQRSFLVACKSKDGARQVYGISHRGTPVPAPGQEGDACIEVTRDVAHLLMHPFAVAPIARDLSIALADAVNRQRLSAAKSPDGQQQQHGRLRPGHSRHHLRPQPVLQVAQDHASSPIPNDYYKAPIEAWIGSIRAAASVRAPEYPPLVKPAAPEGKHAKRR